MSERDAVLAELVHTLLGERGEPLLRHLVRGSQSELRISDVIAEVEGYKSLADVTAVAPPP